MAYPAARGGRRSAVAHPASRGGPGTARARTTRSDRLVSFEELTVALDILGMVIALPVAVWLVWDAARRGERIWVWLCAWLVAAVAGNALFGAVVVVVYLVRRKPVVPGRGLLGRVGRRADRAPR